MAEIMQAKLEQVRAMCVDHRLRTLVGGYAGFGRDGLGKDSVIDCTIHPDDQMLLHSLRHHADANASFSQYFNVGLQQYRAFRQVWSLLGMDRRGDAAVLDFACGYGRLLRFLAPTLPAGALWAAEIQPEALAFVRERFGVNVVASVYQPEAFRSGRKFDLIWVASLFSHLPARLFHAWLAQLKDVLDEGGALCFSAHDGCLLPPGEEMPVEGISFRPYSENENLDASVYGTTYVTEQYVRGVVRAVCGDGFVYHRIPRGLAHEQDLHVVARAGELNLAPLGGFRYGPWGWVDECRLDGGRVLYLRGWAASLDDGPLREVSIRVDGELHCCATGMLREDVQRVFDNPHLARAGWAFSLELAQPAERVFVEVSARDALGEVALLYVGTLHPTPLSPHAQSEPSGQAAAGAGWWTRLRGVFGRWG